MRNDAAACCTSFVSAPFLLTAGPIPVAGGAHVRPPSREKVFFSITLITHALM